MSVTFRTTLAALCVAASAPSAAGPSIVGVTIGEALTWPDCQGNPFPCKSEHQRRLWADGEMIDQYTLVLDPQQVPRWITSASVKMRDGKAMELFITTSGLVSQEEAMAALIAKLGKPAQRDALAGSSRLLGNVPVITAAWRGKGWEASFRGAIRDIHTGIISMAAPSPAKKPEPPL